jgi:hypothetical protein
MFNLFKPKNSSKTISELRQIAKLLYIRAQLVAQLILERVEKTLAPPDRQVEVLTTAIVSEAIRFCSELIPFAVPSRDLVLRCLLKSVWEYHRQGFGKTRVWEDRGWIKLETSVLRFDLMTEIPVGETRQTMISKTLTSEIANALNLGTDLAALTWIYNYVMASLEVKNDNLAYTEQLRKIDWSQAELVHFALSL